MLYCYNMLLLMGSCIGWSPKFLFLAGSCMGSVLHLTLRFSETSKTFEDNQKNSIKKMLCNEGRGQNEGEKNNRQATSKRCPVWKRATESTRKQAKYQWQTTSEWQRENMSLINGDLKGRNRTKRAKNSTGNRLICSKEQAGLVVWWPD